MKKKLVLFLLVAISASLFANFEEELKKADKFFWECKNAESLGVVEKLWSEDLTDDQKFDVAWRMSRAVVTYTDDLYYKGGTSKGDLLAGYDKGAEWAQTAIDINPSSPIGHYWKSANLGRYGQTKGIFDSLDKGYMMRDLLTQGANLDSDFADTFFLIGQLYNEVPKMFFGDKQWAVSSSRLSIAKFDPNKPYIYYTPERNSYYYERLVIHLVDRNWNSGKRVSEMNKLKSSITEDMKPFEMSKYYEATIDFSTVPDYSTKPLSQLSDREEAVAICKWMITWIDKQSPVKYLQDHKKYYESIVNKYQ
ncbi:MAG: hypothetical protein JXR63_12545 [Spirochaetales bacterium]|nr:hypothetical protein [Spirochaetales bacterium]